MSDLKKFEQKHQEKLAQNISSNISIGLDGFARTMGMNKKPSSKKAAKTRITVTMDKYENEIIEERK